MTRPIRVSIEFASAPAAACDIDRNSDRRYRDVPVKLLLGGRVMNAIRKRTLYALLSVGVLIFVGPMAARSQTETIPLQYPADIPIATGVSYPFAAPGT